MSYINENVHGNKNLQLDSYHYIFDINASKV